METTYLFSTLGSDLLEASRLWKSLVPEASGTKQQDHVSLLEKIWGGTNNSRLLALTIDTSNNIIGLLKKKKSSEKNIYYPDRILEVKHN